MTFVFVPDIRFSTFISVDVLVGASLSKSNHPDNIQLSPYRDQGIVRISSATSDHDAFVNLQTPSFLSPTS